MSPSDGGSACGMAFALRRAETAIRGFSLLAGSRAVQPGDLQGPPVMVPHLWDC